MPPMTGQGDAAAMEESGPDTLHLWSQWLEEGRACLARQIAAAEHDRQQDRSGKKRKTGSELAASQAREARPASAQEAKEAFHQVRQGMALGLADDQGAAEAPLPERREKFHGSGGVMQLHLAPWHQGGRQGGLKHHQMAMFRKMVEGAWLPTSPYGAVVMAM